MLNRFNGVFRSTDRGNSWTKIWDGSITTNGSYSVASFGGNLGDRPDGERLAVDPANPNVLYVGTKNDGLWQSMNATASSPTFAKLTNAPTGFVNDAFNPMGVHWETTVAGSHLFYMPGIRPRAGNAIVPSQIRYPHPVRPVPG